MRILDGQKRITYNLSCRVPGPESGSSATEICEPCQVGNEAALSRTFCVTLGRLLLKAPASVFLFSQFLKEGFQKGGAFLLQNMGFHLALVVKLFHM